jgi:hypothetical protein
MTQYVDMTSPPDHFRLARQGYCPSPEALWSEIRLTATDESAAAQRLAVTR